jgi:hypothetical protein
MPKARNEEELKRNRLYQQRYREKKKGKLYREVTVYVPERYANHFLHLAKTVCDIHESEMQRRFGDKQSKMQ